MLPWTQNACRDFSKFQISITMTFIMHLMYVFPQFNSPKASHLLFFMLLWTPNACGDVSKWQISITTLMTHDIYYAPNVCVPLIQFTKDLTSISLHAPMDSKCMQWGTIHTFYRFRSTLTFVIGSTISSSKIISSTQNRVYSIYIYNM